jgi:hypothetical protein
MQRHGIPHTDAGVPNPWALEAFETEGLEASRYIEAPGPSGLEAQLLEDVSCRPTDVKTILHDPTNGEEVAAKAKEPPFASFVNEPCGFHCAE